MPEVSYNKPYTRQLETCTLEALIACSEEVPQNDSHGQELGDGGLRQMFALVYFNWGVVKGVCRDF